MNAHDKAHELARAIKETEQYRELKQAKTLLEQDETNKKIVADWHELQLEAQKCYLLQQELPEEKKKAMEMLGNIVQINTGVRDYLHKEMRFAQLIADIQKILGEAMDI